MGRLILIVIIAVSGVPKYVIDKSFETLISVTAQRVESVNSTRIIYDTL